MILPIKELCIRVLLLHHTFIKIEAVKEEKDDNSSILLI